MSALTIYSEKDAGTPLWQSTDGDEIQQQLNAKGVRFERWQADRDLGVSPTPETVIEAYQHAIDKLVAEKGYQSWDVIIRRKRRYARSFSTNTPTVKTRSAFLLKAPGCSACISATRCFRYCARRTI